MGTLRQEIQSVQSLYSKGVQTQDSRLRPRHIYHELVKARATLLSQKEDKRQTLSQWDYITLPCVELVVANSNECPGVIQAGCQLLRSKFKLPKMIAGMGGDIFQSITTLDGEITFDPVTFGESKYSVGNKFTGGKPRFFIYNEYLWVTVVKRLQVLQITGLFEDPIECWEFPSMCETPTCLDIFERDFPLNARQMDTAKGMAVNNLLSIFVQMRQDKNNDASDDTTTAGGMLHQPQQQG